jgi:RelA/SpoT family (p)ppGpp synthetase
MLIVSIKWANMNLNIYDPLNIILKKQNKPQEECDLIFDAFKFAYDNHDGQYRVSEEPYIIHPVEVAKILAQLQADTPTIISALLHDVLEDTDTKPEEIEKRFGKDVLRLVNGVTKLSKIEFKSNEERQAENFRKMFISMAEDIRVIFLKLADRLHNMRTLNHMPSHKQKKIALETIEIFAPLANRLGIGKIKAELEDLSLRYINPEKYYEIAKSVAQSKSERDIIVEALIDKIQDALAKAGISAKITGRAKHYYSIYSKMNRQQKDIHELFDITAVRVIVDSEKDCYEVLGIIHSTFKPIPGRFKDYIAMPKSNLYRSLHTTLIGPRGKPVEVQIRTQKMHEEAEYGIAAHWKYKESGSSKSRNEVDQKFSWLRKLAEIQNDVSDAKEYVDLVKLDLFSDQVFVFTPKGDVYDLPNDATPLDFAYRVHTEVGHKTVGAKVNGKIVTLDTKLQNGDIIEILTSKIPNPRLDWINIVVTNAAKSKIKLWFKRNKKDDYISIGKSNLEQEIGKAKFDEYHKDDVFNKIAKELNYQVDEDLFAAIGYGETTITKVLNKIKKPEVEPHHVKSKPESKKPIKSINGLEGMLFHIAKCCTPIPGEPIIGVVTRSRGVSVHRIDCSLLDDIPKERYMEINWSDAEPTRTYIINVRIEANDRLGVLQDILAKIADNKTNIAFASVKSKLKRFAIIDLGLEITDIEKLNKIFSSVQSVPDVTSVKRIQSISKK